MNRQNTAYDQKKIRAQIENKEILKKRHEQIVEAAGSLFSKRGYQDTSVRDIAAALNMNISSLYKYVSSKDDVLFLFYRKIHQYWTEMLFATTEKEDADPADQLKDLIRTGLEICFKLKDEILTIFCEARHLEKDSLHIVLSAENAFIESIERLIKRGIKSGQFNPKDTYLTANIIQYMLMIYPLRSWSFKDRYTFDQILQVVTDFILKALGVEPKEQPLR